MLLNLSNHPSTKWTLQQLTKAEETYKTVTDVPFPNVPPEATKKEVRQLAKQLFKQIKQQQPLAVHLMGEMTFTYALVKMLKKAGITCIASTTNRIVEEKDGKKIVQFQFVQFRRY